MTLHNDRKLDQRDHRSINGRIGLKVPSEVVREKCERYLHCGKPIHRSELIHDSAFSIVARYQQEYRGIVEYYRLAYNLHKLNRLSWLMERSLTQTIAHKQRISVRTIHRRYRAIIDTDTGPHPVLQVTLERKPEQKPLVARWGGISLARKNRAVLNDAPLQICGPRTELERKLLADQCELCRSTEKVQVHHVRALKDLRLKGRTEKPFWVQVMAARKRKTLVVCKRCHDAIHAGKLATSVAANRTTLESRVL